MGEELFARLERPEVELAAQLRQLATLTSTRSEQLAALESRLRELERGSRHAPTTGVPLTLGAYVIVALMLAAAVTGFVQARTRNRVSLTSAP